MTLDELLSADHLSEELLKERERFYNRCPVDMSPGTVNRIAWAVNQKFDDFEKLPVIDFDKELIKSGVEYSKSDLYKVADIYREYKNYLVSFTKKINTDEIDEDEGIVDISMLNALFRGKFYEACSNEKMLCDILIDLL
jgi:hypothetical protein